MKSIESRIEKLEQAVAPDRGPYVCVVNPVDPKNGFEDHLVVGVWVNHEFIERRSGETWDALKERGIAAGRLIVAGTLNGIVVVPKLRDEDRAATVE